MSDTNINVATLAKGALVERADVEISRVLENINDKNTDWKKSRKVTLTVEFKAMNESRDSVGVKIQAKSSIAPYDAVTTQLWLGQAKDGHVVAEEFQKGNLPGQIVIDGETGEIVEDQVDNQKVVNFRK